MILNRASCRTGPTLGFSADDVADVGPRVERSGRRPDFVENGRNYFADRLRALMVSCICRRARDGRERAPKSFDSLGILVIHDDGRRRFSRSSSIADTADRASRGIFAPCSFSTLDTSASIARSTKRPIRTPTTAAAMRAACKTSGRIMKPV
jgi:hypothetical protein